MLVESRCDAQPFGRFVLLRQLNAKVDECALVCGHYAIDLSRIIYLVSPETQSQCCEHVADRCVLNIEKTHPKQSVY